jgi:hypothetical protein
MIQYNGSYYAGMEFKILSNLDIKINNQIINSRNIMDQLFAINFVVIKFPNISFNNLKDDPKFSYLNSTSFMNKFYY